MREYWKEGRVVGENGDKEREREREALEMREEKRKHYCSHSFM